jgi:GNAT superfamily N-acetyltransferase
LNPKYSAALILENDGQAIGYAFLSPGKEPNRLVPLHSIQIKWFYILEEWTGRKLGDLLMSRCHEHATALGPKVPKLFEIHGRDPGKRGVEIDDSRRRLPFHG